MTDVEPRSFSGYVGMKLLPPFPLDMWWPCENFDNPIDQRNDFAPEMHYLQNVNQEWDFRQGAISPPPPLEPSSIHQDFQIVQGSGTDPSETTYSIDVWKHFGPPLQMHADGSFSMAWILQRISGAFIADYMVALNGSIFVSIHVDNSGGSLSQVFLWDGVSNYVEVLGGSFATAMPARNGGIIAFMLIMDNTAKQILTASGTPSLSSVLSTGTKTFSTYAPASNWWLRIFMAQSNFKFCNIYVWRRVLTTDERTVWFKHAARIPPT